MDRITIKQAVCLLVFLFIFCHFSYSQQNFQPGYIIKSNGDTLKGYIDYRNWKINPNRISFREKTTDSNMLFTPLTAQEFSVSKEIYVGAIVQAEISPLTVDRISRTPTPNIMTDTTFLEAIVIGPKSLYYSYNKYAKDQYYIKEGDSYKLLLYKKYEAPDDQNNFVLFEDLTFINQLGSYFSDYPNIQSKTQNIKYSKSSIQSLFNEYYATNNHELKFKREKEKIKIEYGLLAGISFNSLNFKPQDLDFHVNKSSSFSGGVFLDIIGLRRQGKWSLCNEIFYTSYSNSFTYNKSEELYELGMSYIKMNNMIRFKYPFGKTFAFVNAGMSNGYSISEKLPDTHLFDYTRKHEQGYLIGCGMKYNRYSLEFRLEKGNGIFESRAVKEIATRYYVLLGYRF